MKIKVKDLSKTQEVEVKRYKTKSQEEHDILGGVKK